MKPKPLAWIVLAAALAVPAFLFMRWLGLVRDGKRFESGPAIPSASLFGGARREAAPRPAEETAPRTPDPEPAAPASGGLPAAAAQGGEPSWRDPTLSVEERRALSRRSEPAQPKRSEVEDKIVIYGVVSTPNGINAMVNDRIVKEGDVVLGALVRRIDMSRVVFQHQGRTFVKKVP